MELRHDALAAAAEIVLALVRRPGAAFRDGGPPSVPCAVAPGAVSVIPGSARFGADLGRARSRSSSGSRDEPRARVAEIAAARGVAVEVQLTRAGHVA